MSLREPRAPAPPFVGDGLAPQYRSSLLRRYALATMTDAQPTKSNGSLTALWVIGGIATVVGGIVALVLNQRRDFDQNVSDFTVALGGYASNAVASDTVGIWVGVVIAILGVLCLIGGLIVRAARG